MTRRLFLQVAPSIFFLPSILNASASNQYENFYNGDRTLLLSRDGQILQKTFFRNSVLNRMAYEEICYFLQDKKEKVAVEMSIELLSGIAFIQKFLFKNGIYAPYEVHSGYRTRKTNALIEGASQDSYHIRGGALDGKVRGVDNKTLALIADRVGLGGIGLYDHFVHLDVGAHRRWSV